MLQNIVCKSQNNCYFDPCIVSQADANFLEVARPSGTNDVYRWTFTVHDAVCLGAYTFNTVIFDNFNIITQSAQIVDGNDIHYDFTFGFPGVKQLASNTDLIIEMTVTHTSKDREIIN